MATSVEKITISLPKEDIRLMEELGTRISLTRSRLIRKAVEEWLKKKEKELLEEQYKEYYSKERNREKHRKLARQMWEKAKETWPEY